MLFLQIGDDMVLILNLLTDCHKGHCFLAVLNKAGARDTYPLDAANTDSHGALPFSTCCGKYVPLLDRHFGRANRKYHLEGL